MNKYIKATVIAGAALLATSCEIYPNGYTSFSYSTDGYSSSVAWTAASYDANGFPIYGYAYGRPVYGYTVSGSPIYSISLLYSGCYVPNWKPASWCKHHHSYPSGCHHAPKPPKHDKAHKPHVRPAMHAPIHKRPESVLGKPRPVTKPAPAAKPAPAPKPVARPSTVQRPTIQQPSKPTITRPSTVQRPTVQQPSKPITRPSTVQRPTVQQPSKPITRPSTVQRPTVQQPSKPITRPSTVQRPTVQQPSKPITRPSTVQRPTATQPSKPSVTRPSTVTRQGSGPRRSR